MSDTDKACSHTLGTCTEHSFGGVGESYRLTAGKIKSTIRGLRDFTEYQLLSKHGVLDDAIMAGLSSALIRGGYEATNLELDAFDRKPRRAKLDMVCVLHNYCPKCGAPLKDILERAQ